METIGIIDQLIGLFERFRHAFFPPKPDLHFEEQDFVHWYDVDIFQSGIIAEMFIINRGKKTTSLRKVDIIKMNPDHLQYKRRAKTYQIELPKDEDTRFRETFFFTGDHLGYKKIEFKLEFTHTEGRETINCESKLISNLEPKYKLDKNI